MLLSLPPAVFCEINVGSSEKGILKEQWRYHLHYYEWGWFGSSPTIIDFDESQEGLEIITGSDEYCEYFPELGKNACGIWRVFDCNGNIIWARDTETDEARSSPVVIDLDGDNEFEVVGGTTSGLFVEVMDHLGNFKWTFPKLPGFYVGGPFVWVSSPAVADIDKSIKGLEIVIGNRVDGKVYAFDGANNNGKNDGITITSVDWYWEPIGEEGEDWDVLWIFTPPEGIGENGIVSTPAIADVDKDNKLEVVIASTNGNLYILNAFDGVLEYKFSTDAPIYSSPAVANIDKDRYLEIIIGSTDSNVYCFQWNGHKGKTKWIYSTQGPIYSSAAIEDIDEDGEFEIVIGSNDGKIYALSASGRKEWDFPTGGAVYSSPAIANRGKDFGFDIYVGSDDGYLYLLDGKTGTKIDRFRVYHSWFGGIHTSPSVADIDGDNKLEIVFYDWGQGSVYGGHTFWVLKDTKSNCDKYSIQWGMFRGNPSRTGTSRIRPLNAVRLTKEVIGGPYIYGAKGHDHYAKEFVSSLEIKGNKDDKENKYWLFHACGCYYSETTGKCVPFDGSFCKCYYDEKEKTCKVTPKGRIEFNNGLDCSGLIFWAYNRAYFFKKEVSLDDPTLPLFYQWAQGIYRGNCKEISKNELRPGDLLFYNPWGDKNKKMTHVMMYVGPFSYKGKQYNVIHASGFAGEIIPAIYYSHTEEVTTIDPLTGKKEILKVTAYGRVTDYKLDILFVAHSPVGLIITDPTGDVITRDVKETLSMCYMNYDIDGDGELDDIIAIPQRKLGKYQIQVVPEPDALPTETYTLEVTIDGQTTILAKNIPISDIPTEPYVITVDLDNDNDIDQDDLNILLTYRNQPASECPECDLDGDGIITVLDARKLVLLCTRPGCATESE